MGWRKFGRSLIGRLEKEERVNCMEHGCDGHIKFVRKRYELSYCEGFHEEVYFYRCTKDKNHRWKVLNNSLSKILIYTKY